MSQYDSVETLQRYINNRQWRGTANSLTPIDTMPSMHVAAARIVASRYAAGDEDPGRRAIWRQWVIVFDDLLQKRGNPKIVPSSMPRTVMMVCHCGAEYEARKCDLARGWMQSCSGECKRRRKAEKLPAATRKR